MASCDISTLSPFCDPFLGSIREIWVIRAADVVSIPPACDQEVVTDPVEIKPGTGFLPLAMIRDTGRFQENVVETDQGPANEYTITFRHPCLRPTADRQLRKLKGAEVVVMTRDYQGHIRLSGTKAFPLIFRYNGDTAETRGGQNIYSITIEGQTPNDFPAIFLTPDIQPPNELLVPSANLTVSSLLCSSTYSAAGSQFADGTPITGSSTGVTLRYSFYYLGTSLTYAGNIAPNADPSVLANWSIIAGTRSAAQFNTDFVENISPGGTGFNFTVNTQDLSAAFSGRGSLTVELIVIEGVVNSPVSSALQGFCNAPPQLQNLFISSTGDVADPSAGDVLTANATYLDIDGDLQDTITYEWFSYDDASWSTGETSVGTGATFVVPATTGKYYTFKAQPFALTGILTGAIYKCLPGTGSVSDDIAPLLQSLSPADESTGADHTTLAVATYNEPVFLDAGGAAQVYVNGVLAATYTASDPQLTTSGNTVTVDYSIAGFYADVEIRFTDLVKDAAGNFAANIAAGGWNFETALPASGEAFRYNTTLSGTHTLIIQVQPSEQYAVDWGDGNIETFTSSGSTDTLTHSYPSTASKTVIVYCTAASVKWIDLASESLTGTLDVSGLPLDRLYVNNNPALTGLTLEPTAPYFIIWAYSCGLTSVALDNITFAANCSLRFASNSITSFTYAGANALAGCQFFDLNNNSGITGAFDATWINFRANNNGCQFLLSGTGITSVDHTGRSGVIAAYNIQNTNVSGTLDISMFTFWPTGGNLNTTNVTGLTDINMPASGPIGVFASSGCALGVIDLKACTITPNAAINMSQNGMVTAETNGNLVNIRDAAATSGATGSVNIAGTNAAPTAGPPDGDGAAADLATAGYSVTTSV